MPYKRCLLAVHWATVTRQETERERDIGVVITIRYSMFFMVSTLWLKLENLSIPKN